MDKQYITVGALNRYLKAKIDGDEQLQKIYIKGEISNFKRHRSGHLYFTLKDEYSRINAVMFYSKARKVLFDINDGMKVLITASVSVYDVAGTYQLYIDTIEQDGLGNLFLRFENLKKQLSNEGLFNSEHKIAIPRYPQRIAILSAYPSAALGDIIRTIKLRFPVVRLMIFPIPVQGKDAHIEIIRTLKYVDTLRFSTIILARGGGSLEDLWNFNEEMLARSIYQCSTPIITGVGHEIDFTIADFVADYRAATPTAAAVKATPDLLELQQNVASIQYKLNTLIRQKVNLNKELLSKAQTFYLFKNPDKLYEEKKVKVDYLTDNLNNLFKQKIIYQNNRKKILLKSFDHQRNIFILKQRNQIDVINRAIYNQLKLKIKHNQEKFYYTVSKLNTLSPLQTLERGYAILAKDNQIITRASHLHSGDEIDIRMQDGVKKAIVK